MAKKKNKPRHRPRGGIMGRSDIPLAERIRLDQLEKINANRERAAKVVLYAYSIAMHELEGIGYRRLIRFAQVYRELEDEFYEDPEVGMEHVKQRLMEMGMEISGQWLKAPREGHTQREQEVRDNIMNAAQVAQIVGAVAMNDEFGFGQERQLRIRSRVEELTREYAQKGMKPLLDGMEKIGFYIHGEKAIHFTDEDGNVVSAKKALKQNAANDRQVTGK